MSGRKVRLELWIEYDSETGYVWPKVYEQKPDFDERVNAPIRKLRLISEPYVSRNHANSGSFGKEVPVRKRKKK